MFGRKTNVQAEPSRMSFSPSAPPYNPELSTPTIAPAFCDRISRADYEYEAKNNTREEIEKLMLYIAANPSEAQKTRYFSSKIEAQKQPKGIIQRIWSALSESRPKGQSQSFIADDSPIADDEYPRSSQYSQSAHHIPKQYTAMGVHGAQAYHSSDYLPPLSEMQRPAVYPTAYYSPRYIPASQSKLISNRSQASLKHRTFAALVDLLMALWMIPLLGTLPTLMLYIVTLILFGKTLGKLVMRIEVGYLDGLSDTGKLQTAPLQIVFIREGVKLFLGWNINVLFYLFTGEMLHDHVTDTVVMYA
eukprot:TRINITY_DN6955_c0_g1_i1.p1 TRINITY_DN6955_c0_g1~~TRINITY_DN6955_c0_g1_i1.p1  ORF type:complete len:313 (-),score=88.04 TRINITY_DN6955_c0_g1_i1:8-919(-)